MLLHWLTTAWRSLIANPLFSAITMISLSIGCCGALLAGANILQHVSFDRWIPNGERVFVITRKSDPFAMPGMTIRVEGANVNRPNIMVTAPMLQAIEEKIPGMESQARMIRGPVLLQEDQDEMRRRQAAGPLAPGELPPPFAGTVYVDPSFFDVFELTFVEGSSEQLVEPDQILLTESRAKRLFGNQAAVGQTVAGVEGRAFTVAGVLADMPPSTFFVFESVASVSTLEMIEAAAEAARKAEEEKSAAAQGTGAIFFSSTPTRPGMSSWQSSYGGAHFVKMASGVDREVFAEAALEQIKAAGDLGSKQVQPAPPGAPPGFVMPSPKYEFGLMRLWELHLAGQERISAPSTGDLAMLTTLGLAAFALLAVSAFNYVTLSLARALRRRREVAVRKALGASRNDLIGHYLAESGFVTGLSLLLGFVLAVLLHPWFARAIGQREAMFDLFDPLFLAWTLAGFALLAAAVGAYPAFYLANVRPQTALGEGGVAAPGRIGQVVTASLLGLQVAAATALLIVAMTMGAQARFIETRPMGFDMKNRYQLSQGCPFGERMSSAALSAMMQRCDAVRAEMLKETPGIDKSFAFSGQIFSEVFTSQGFARSAQGEEIGRANAMQVDTEFLQGMGSTLLAGRFFDSQSAYDRQLIDRPMGMPAPGSPRPARIEKMPVIITRAALKMLEADTPEAALGQQFYRKGPAGSYPLEVVGVVEDWQQRPLKYEVFPIVFTPGRSAAAIVEVQPDRIDQVRTAMLSFWRERTGEPNAFLSLQGMAEMQERAYLADFRLMRAVSSFAFVAIVVAGLGVFGLSAFEMRRRVREIGIRKSLGASPMMLAGMVVGRRVAFAAAVSLIAWPIGFWIGSQWLARFVYRTELGWFVPPLATLIVAGAVALAVGLSSLRAAQMRPSSALAK